MCVKVMYKSPLRSHKCQESDGATLHRVAPSKSKDGAFEQLCIGLLCKDIRALGVSKEQNKPTASDNPEQS